MICDSWTHRKTFDVFYFDFKTKDSNSPVPN